MYPRVLRNFVTCSSKLNIKTNLKSTSLVFSALATQKLLPHINNKSCVKYYSKLTLADLMKLPKDPAERNRKMEEDAQNKLNEMRKESPETDKLIKILELEITVMIQDGQRAPEKIQPSQWLELLKQPNRSQRRKYLEYLFIVEKQKQSRKQEQYEKNLEYERMKKEEKSDDEEEKGIIYGVGHNSFFRRINDISMNNFYNWNCIKSIMFGNKIIYDFSFERYMNPKEKKSCAKQIREAFALNRVHDYPFDIYFCNVDMSGELIKHLYIMIPSLMDDDFPITVSEKSYLELFDKSKLVYLTSDAEKHIQKHNPDSVYIIGALVDKGPCQPLSMAKAKEEGIAMAKLPLDRYLRFGYGSSKNLAINQVLAIMLDAQNHDWETAFKHVPTRKLMDSRIASMEKKLLRDTFRLQNNTELKTNDDFDSQYLAKKIKFYESKQVNDYSHTARAKLRDRWNK